MTRKFVSISTALIAGGALIAGCTLILDTEALITPCTVDQECDDALGEGFECQENACLPVDESDESDDGGEGE